MKKYNLLGREVYIEPTTHSPVRESSRYNLSYKGKPYFVKYVDTGELAIDGIFCSVATARESIEFQNKGY